LIVYSAHFQDHGFERGINSQSFPENMILFTCPQAKETTRFSAALFRPSSAPDCIFVSPGN
jgi:hypothetical protein